MSQTDLLVLARQGNVEAIATLMNRKLTSVQVAVEAQLENSCLLLQLIAHGELPSKETLVTFVRRGMNILKVRQVDLVQVSAWQAGATETVWVEWVELGEDGYVQRSGGQYRAAHTVNTPQGQAFGVNLASLAATASNGQSGGMMAAHSPQLPLFDGDRETLPAGAPASLWDGDPEGYYRTWMVQQNLGWQYRWQVPRLAAFLVYFLNPAETLLDMVGVIYQGRRCVLLLTDQRLCCLGAGFRQQAVREYFEVPLAAFDNGSSEGAQVAIAPTGLEINYLSHGLGAAVRWSKVDQGQNFLRRSLQRVVPMDGAIDNKAIGGEGGDDQGTSRNSNERNGSNRNPGLSADLSSRLTLWSSGIPGDRLSLWFYALLIFITVVVLILLFLTVP